MLGLELEAGWWTKTTTAPGAGDDARYLCCRGAGRRVEYEYRSVATVRASIPEHTQNIMSITQVVKG